MPDSSETQQTNAELRDEITRLQNELEQANVERTQAAEYGLAVLTEKQQLEQQCEELEALYETTKHELSCAKDVSCLKCIKLVVIVTSFQSMHPVS